MGVPGPRPGAGPAQAGATARWSGPRRSLQSLPLRGKQAAWWAKVEEKREQAQRALTYVELYGAYTECEAIYGVDHLLALQATLDAEDQADVPHGPAGRSTGTATSTRSTCRRS